jgi:Flp pilus assembly protein TadD
MHEAEMATRKVIELAPQSVSSHCTLAILLAKQGKFNEANEAAEKEESHALNLYAKTVVYYLAGRSEQSDVALKELLDLERKRASTTSHAYQIASAFVLRDDADLAFQWLYAGFSERDAGISLVRGDPLFRSLHSDVRWSVFTKKMGFY